VTPGPGSITDVAGLRVGHTTRAGRGWRTGTTVVLAPDGAVAGVDVRGSGPGTRETDALDPRHLVDRVHAVCLSGGSAYGLAAADGVMHWLAARDLGVRVGPAPGEVVPVVPAAVIFDLGRGGAFGNRPDESFGRRAVEAAAGRGGTTVPRGACGAGTGAIAGGLQGGIGSASRQLATAGGTFTVGALAVVNAAGAVVEPATGLPWVHDGTRLVRPDGRERRALADHLAALRAAVAAAPLNTTIGVVATSAALTKAEAAKLAAVAHDGLARAVRPAHSMFDGDVVFALATGHDELPPGPPRFRDPASRPGVLNALLDAAAQCFAAACTDAVTSARAHPGGPPAYRDLCPSAFRNAGTRN
jgi:L-aminopeptidase/D-esterase-like protein